MQWARIAQIPNVAKRLEEELGLAGRIRRLAAGLDSANSVQPRLVQSRQLIDAWDKPENEYAP
jgi:hypothetical protein